MQPAHVLALLSTVPASNVQGCHNLIPFLDNSRSSVAVTLSVWNALFLREALSRISGGRAAWVWLFLAPVAHLAILMVIFTIIRTRFVPGIEIAMFLAVGILAYGLFRTASTRSMAAISANRALFAYRQVKPVDVVLVRAFLEGVIQLFVALIVFAGMSLFGFDVLPSDPLMVMLIFVLLWIFGTGLGLLLSVGSTLVPEIGQVANLLFIPLYFLSGVLFSPSMLPPGLLEWLLLNPLMQGIELLRGAFMSGYQMVGGIDLFYLTAFAFVSLFLGLAVHVRFSSRLLMQ
jgi:capsular polysaccharide transport system permease protein